MKIFDRFRKKQPPKNYTEEELRFLHALGLTPNQSKQAINQVTYYTCCKIISESIGKLPFELFKNEDGNKVLKTDLDINYLLTVRPNPYTSPTILITTLMQNLLRYGNGYLYLDFKGYKLRGIYNLPSDRVKIMIDNKGILDPKRKIVYRYNDTDGKTYTIDADSIIHLKMSDTVDGIVGKSVAETLASTLSTSLEAESYLENLYQNGLSAKAILQYTGDLDAKAEERLVKGLDKYMRGSGNAGGILPLPLGLELKPLDITLADAEFSSIREVNALNIAGAFGVSPTFINIYKSSSYNNTEMESLRFLSNCLQFYITQLENEINYKCLTSNQVKQGYFIKINVNELLRTDLKTQSEVYSNYVTNGILTTNEVRNELDYNNIEGGDNVILNGSYTTLDNVVKGINYNQNVNQDDNQEEQPLEGGDNK